MTNKAVTYIKKFLYKLEKLRAFFGSYLSLIHSERSLIVVGGVLRYLLFLFRFDGRIGRKAYAVGFIMILSVLSIWISLVFAFVSEGERVGLIILGILPVLLSFFSLSSRRMNDFGTRVKVEIQYVSIPIVDTLRSILEFHELFTRTGDPKENKYGLPPRM